MDYVDVKRWGHFRNKRWQIRRGNDGSNKGFVGFTSSI